MAEARSGREPEKSGARKGASGEDARLAGDRAVLHLVDKLADPDPIVRERAALALGEMGDQRAFDTLLDIAQAGDFNIAERAVHGLTNLALPHHFDALFSLTRSFTGHSVAVRLAHALIACDRVKARAAFVESLSAHDYWGRYQAVVGISVLDDPDSVPIIARMLEDEDEEVRRLTALILGDKQDARAIPALIAALDDLSLEIADKAALSLGKIGDPQVAPILLRYALGERPGPSAMACQALSELKNPDMTAPLLNAACDPARDVLQRQWILKALGTSDDQSIVPKLIAIYENPAEVWIVHYEALVAVSRIGGPAAESLLAREAASPDETTRLDACIGLSHIPSEHSAQLILSVVADPAVTELQCTYSWLTHKAAERGWPVGPFIEAARGDNPHSRPIAIRMLSVLGGPEAEAEMCALMQNPDREVRAEVTHALMSSTSAQRIGLLIRALNDTDPQIRTIAARALGYARDPLAVEPLIAALGDQDGGVRFSVVGALGQIGASEAVPALIMCLADTTPSEIEDEASSVEAFLFERICDFAAEALENIRTPESIAAVEAWRRTQPPEQSDV